MKTRRLVWLLPLCLLLSAHAHRFSVSWEIEGDRLHVRAVLEGSPAAGAVVEVRDPSGGVLARGTLDAAGRFQWPLAPVTGDLVVVVKDEEGHRRTVTVPAASRRGGAASADPLAPAEAATEAAAPPRSVSGGRADGTEPLALRVVVGLTFLLAGGAAWMSYRNHRRLVALERRLPAP